MRALARRLALLVLAWAVALPAAAATLAATPATIAAVLKTAQAGDTVTLTGEFPGLGLSGLAFAPALTLDASGATITRLTYAQKVAGLTIRGGTWREGLRIDGGERVRILGGTFQGPFGAATWAAVHLNWVKDVEVAGVDASGMVTGIIVTGADGFRIADNYLHELQSDGIDLAGARNGVVAGNIITAPSPKAGDHPDGIQLLQAGAAYPVENIRIEGNVITGRMQGIFAGNGPYRNLTLRGNRVSAGFVNGIGVGEASGLVLEDNEVSTLPGSPWQSLIGTRGSTGVTLTGLNVARAYQGRPEAVLSAPAPAALAPVEAAELVALRARLAAALKALAP